MSTVVARRAAECLFQIFELAQLCMLDLSHQTLRNPQKGAKILLLQNKSVFLLCSGQIVSLLVSMACFSILSQMLES